MFNKIKAVKDLRDQAKQMQNAMSEITEVGEAAWGKVKITIDGNQNITNVEIDEAMMDNREKLQEEIMNAFNNGLKKIQKKMAGKMKEMGGLDALKNFDF